ncbi:MAG: transglycosylase SLT domain-containing protein [Gemmatimonadetes bacterium]|nr:transglycosylase SLT domain-containing protein [Gemmatimonadota bacterium]
MTRLGTILALVLLSGCGRMGLRPLVAPTAVSAPTASDAVPMLSPQAVAAVPAGEGAPVVFVEAEPVVVTGAESVGEVGGSAVDIDEAASNPAPVTTPVWDIDVASYEGQDRVAYFVSRYTGPSRATFQRALTRQTRYAELITTKLRAGGLPEDMLYLALIESAYDVHAYSRAAAVGMWQFMTTTARGVGLRVDWWIDERRDPVRSTDGAIRFLNELTETFGSVYLAAAAYNGGPGRVSRGLTQHATSLEGTAGDDLFFGLAERNALRQETKDYVPKLIAAALVGKDPARFGVRGDSMLPFRWDSVRVPVATPLAAIAKALDVPLDTIKDYNPQILRGMTPPIGGELFLRVPVGSAQRFAEGFDALDLDERSAVRTVVSNKGDYVAKIAQANGLTARQLNWYNPGLRRMKSGNLVTGQRVLIPRRDVAAAARDIPDPKVERYGSSAARIHLVKNGESLGSIARRYGTSVQRLKSLNRISGSVIRPGQRIRVR